MVRRRGTSAWRLGRTRPDSHEIHERRLIGCAKTTFVDFVAERASGLSVLSVFSVTDLLKHETRHKGGFRVYWLGD